MRGVPVKNCSLEEIEARKRERERDDDDDGKQRPLLVRSRGSRLATNSRTQEGDREEELLTQKTARTS